MASLREKKISPRIKRHKRIRLQIRGTSSRPRLCVFRSAGNIYAQIINDDEGKVVLTVSTLSKEIKESVKKGGNIEAASAVGKLLAEKASGQKIKKVVFDRGGYVYHGRVRALADEARKGGLEF